MPANMTSARPILAWASRCPSSTRLVPLYTQSGSPFTSTQTTPTPNRPSSRTFSATAAPQTKTIKAHLLPSDLIPPYPYGERRIYKQSNRGLYGDARIRFGNNVAPKHNKKSRRYWRPNVHVKAFYLPALDARIKTRLTLRVLKTIRREDGLENYLLKSKPARIRELGPGGWNLRWLLMQSQAVQRRFNEERVALGMQPVEVEDRDDIIQYALDRATPGPLSLRSRRTLDELRAAVASAFTLGDEALADLEGLEELSDEQEAALLAEMDAADAQAELMGEEAAKKPLHV